MSTIPTLPIHTRPAALRPAYAELHCLSDFSFGRGASSAQELFERAKRNGYRALAITDEGSLAGIVRALEASRATGVALIVGSEVQLDDGPKLVLLVEDLAGYGTLCRLLTRGRRRSAKGEYRLTRADFDEERLDGGLLDGGRRDDCLPGLLVLWLPAPSAACPPPFHDPDAALPLRVADVADPGSAATHADGLWLRQRFDQRLWLAVELHHGADDAQRLPALLALADALAIPAVATGDVHMHARGRRALQDTITAIRHRTTIAEAGKRLFANGERHLRTRQALAAIYPLELLDESVRIAARCTFQLDQLRYQYPRELVPDGHTPTTWLRHLTEQGVQWRWPENTGMDSGVHTGTHDGTHGGSGADTDRARAKALPLIEKELALIAKLGYEPYFLTVHDLVAFARGRGILCQGRGSAANSAVCFALGITEIDPGRMNVLFERFLSEERKEPPDIDVDFEHERREEVIQYLYRRYGRERAALAATVIRYRARSAVRDVARALGLPADQLAQLSRSAGSWSSEVPAGERLREHGFDPGNPVVRRLLALVGELLGKPRHLSQHVGGFVISEAPLHMLVPVENAAMPDRTIIQWDKDDLDVLGLIKVDVLALGMLTCVRKTLDLVRAHRGRDLSPATIPAEDPATYGMIQRADVVGVFQIESRAQMAMLPRLKPACFYDLVIEVAIVRPGPIQGGMVHPYLRRRQGLEPVDYPSEELRPVFERTLGIPLFQEQVMQLAITAAEYTPGEADQLRRAMAAWKRHGGMGPHHDRLVTRMVERGYTPEFAERIFEQIQGFGSYGFPESHAASFAMITYVSCWLKCHEPAAFSCALLNSLPMGFYQPPQLVADARRHGIEVRPVDVCHSDWDCTLEPWPGDPIRQPALRLGLRLARGMREDAAVRISAERVRSSFRDLDDLAARADLDRGTLDLLAEAAALRSLAGHRHRARWSTAGTERQLPLFANANALGHASDSGGSDPGASVSRASSSRVCEDGVSGEGVSDARVADAGSAAPRAPPARRAAEPRIAIPPPSAFENTHADYASTGLSLDTHPVALVRRGLQQRRYCRSTELTDRANGRHARFAGLVILRQRPATASGVTFLTLEDEHGMVNVVVWNDLAERQRRVLLESRLLAVHGRLESDQGSRHLIASRLEDLTPLLSGLAATSRDFR